MINHQYKKIKRLKYKDISLYIQIMESLFAQDSVKKLTDEDFMDNSKSKIELKQHDNSYILVLFYTNNMKHKDILSIWPEAAKKVVGPIFASVNLSESENIKKSLTKLNMKAGTLKWSALTKVPFILIYNKGIPITFYDGEITVQDIINYSLILSCKFE